MVVPRESKAGGRFGLASYPAPRLSVWSLVVGPTGVTRVRDTWSLGLDSLHANR